MVLERLLWRVTCPNHGSFFLLPVARGGSSGPIRKLILLHTQVGDVMKFPHALGFESLHPFFQSQQSGSMFHSHTGGWR